MPLQETSGAASYDAFGGGAPAAPIYIEDVFSTWLYQGNGSGQTITNGIDLAGDGGMVWAKARNEAYSHELFDTARGSLSALISNTADSQNSYGPYDFLSSGFRYRAGYIGNANYSNTSYVSWAFRKQPKFFDVVLYTGDGTNNRAIPHNLNSVPGCIIVKATSASLGWGVKHRSLTASQYLVLNDTAAASTALNPWSQNPTSSEFYVNGTAPSLSNGNGIQYVAYVFAHNAGGFGLTGTDNVISCGSFTGGSEAIVNLGWEPQFLLIKAAGASADWNIIDTMRGWSFSTQNALQPNLSAAESNIGALATITSTGFTSNSFGSGAGTVIYIAIRRGPMKVPTTGTSVFTPIASTSPTGTVKTTGFPVDMQIQGYRLGGVSSTQRFVDRLRGVSTSTTESGQYLASANTNAEVTTTNTTRFWDNTGFQQPSAWDGSDTIFWNFRRAPGFFDEVCWTANGSAQNISHNLTVAPELIIFKGRTVANNWYVGANFTSTTYTGLYLDATNAGTTGAYDNAINAQPTAAVFRPGSNLVTSGNTVVTYLFATCPGVSKVTNFTGNGSSQTINCGFTSGARFVMIKATSTTGNWTVFDSARGISAGGDPALYLNSTAAEVTGIDAIDADSTGFIVNQEGTFNLNASGVQYLVLAIS